MFSISVATLFPEMFDTVLNCSILKRAVKFKCVEFNVFNIRNFAFNKHNSVDDSPYGGGNGMLMQAEPIYKCYEHALDKKKEKLRVIYMSPKGRVLTQKKVIELSRIKQPLFLICGHYEGIDQRLIDEIVDEELSIGDYVLTGGELAALVVIDSVVRLLPGVLASSKCYEEDSHFNGILEYPQYTRPRIWHDKEVPEVLLSGNHYDIRNWREKEAYEVTRKNRPDLLKKI